MLLQLLVFETLVLFASVIFGLTYFAILFTIVFGIAWAPS